MFRAGSQASPYRVGDEATHEQSKKASYCKVTRLVFEARLSRRDDRPCDDDERDPDIGAELFGNEAGWKFCGEEGQ